MRIYAVIDTNVIVASLLAHHNDSATRLVLKAVFSGVMTPLYHNGIIEEYYRVLRKKKLQQKESDVRRIVNYFVKHGLYTDPAPADDVVSDPDDVIFYVVALSRQDESTWLVAGNSKHYPNKCFIVTPAEMMDIIRRSRYK